MRKSDYIDHVNDLKQSIVDDTIEVVGEVFGACRDEPMAAAFVIAGLAETALLHLCGLFTGARNHEEALERATPDAITWCALLVAHTLMRDMDTGTEDICPTELATAQFRRLTGREPPVVNGGRCQNPHHHHRRDN